MNRDELKRLIVGPIATVPTPFDDDFEVDYGMMADLTRLWVENGLVTGKAVIKVAAAMGEGPMLSEAEWPSLLRTVVQAAKGRAAIVCGIFRKDTKRSVEDAKRAQDLGAIGLQVAPPIFSAPTQDDLLRYFEALSNAIEIGVIIYDNPWLPNGHVLPETLLKMADLEHIVGIKWGTVRGEPDFDEMVNFAHIFNVIDNSKRPAYSHKLGARGYINLTADVYPPHDLHVWELLESRQYDQAADLFHQVNDPLRALYAKMSERSGGEARMKKGMYAIMGHPIGASRPPSLPMNAEEMAELRDLLISFGWPVPS